MSTPRAMPERRSGEAGFTLIEMLIATLLMGLILAALTTVTAQWLPNWNRGMARLQRDERVAFGLGRMVADLSVAETVPAGNATHVVLFDGGALGVTFVRTAVGPNTQPGLEVVRLREAADLSGPQLIRERALYTPSDGGVLPHYTNAVPLIGPPFRVTFAYAGADGAWHSTWQSAVQLPRTVRITIRDAITQQTLALSTAVLVHVDTPAECARDGRVDQCKAQGGGGPGAGAR